MTITEVHPTKEELIERYRTLIDTLESENNEHKQEIIENNGIIELYNKRLRDLETT